MNWTFLLTVYGQPTAAPNPLLQHLAARATSLLVGSNTESLGFHLFDGEVQAVAAEQSAAPYSYYMFSDSAPDELQVVNRGTTYFGYFNGVLADMVPPRQVLELMRTMNRNDGEPADNYTALVSSRVTGHLHGKFSVAVAQLGPQPSFIFISKKLPLNVWIVTYGGVYYILASNVTTLATDLEDALLASKDANCETWFQQRVEIEEDTTLIIRAIFLITKFRKRMRSFVNRSQRTLLICNFLRRYLQNQGHSLPATQPVSASSDT